MARWRLFYHLVWATKGREPILGEDEWRIVSRSMRTTCTDQGFILHAMGHMPDHVHVAVSARPAVAIATVAGRLKGASAHAVNNAPRADRPTFAWQTDYGVDPFSERALPIVVASIQNQSARHAANQIWTTIERTTDRP